MNGWKVLDKGFSIRAFNIKVCLKYKTLLESASISGRVSNILVELETALNT